MQLSAHERGLLPSASDVASFEEHGFYVSPIVLPTELVEEALYGARRYYAGERDTILPLAGGYLDWREEHGNVLRLNDYSSLQNEEIGRLVRYPLLGAIAARLTRARGVRLFHDQLISKPPGVPDRGTTVGWHVDRDYWHTCSSRAMVTAWIPLQDCSEEMGPLAVIDGSHKWQLSQHMRTFNDRDLDALERTFPPGVEVRRVPLVLKRGQVSFHDGSTIHGSLENRSGLDRVALTVHIQGADNRYAPAVGPDGRPALHINDLLCRRGDDGMPDYTDPEVCPLLWTEEAE